jgi:hypothetical protein
MNFQFYRMRVLPSLDEERLGILESLCFMELVTEIVRAIFRHFNVKARGADMHRINALYRAASADTSLMLPFSEKAFVLPNLMLNTRN